jgi:ribonuclease HII
VIAKVHRDALMRELDAAHPGYGLASHKGYGTPEHRQALKQQGPCVLHRKTFAPVKAVDPDAAIEELVSGELFDFDLPIEEEADWACD